MMSLSLIHLYADDTILYTSGPSLDTVLTNLQLSFNAIQHSFRGLQLLLREYRRGLSTQVEDQCGRCVVTYPYHLRAAGQEVQDPVVEGGV